MLLSRKYATPIAMTWQFTSLQDFFRQSFFSLIALGVLAATAFLTLERRGFRKAWLMLYLTGVSAFFFFIAKLIEVPDIRFIPPALITAIFSISFFAAKTAARFSYFGKKLKQSTSRRVFSYIPLSGLIAAAIPLAAFAGASIFVGIQARNVSSWFTWNYSGYEAKQEYPNLKAMTEALSGDFSDGRILWEKQNQNDNADFGSERGFENLYLFTGRGSAGRHPLRFQFYGACRLIYAERVQPQPDRSGSTARLFRD